MATRKAAHAKPMAPKERRERIKRLVRRSARDMALEYCPTKVKIRLTIYDWQGQQYRYMPQAGGDTMVVANPREMARLEMLLQKLIASKRWTDEAHEEG